jgi:subtilisin family serine protease
MRKRFLPFFGQWLKIAVLCTLSLLIAACGSSGGSGSGGSIADACQLPQDQKSSLQSALFVAPSRSGMKQLIVRLSHRESDFQSLIADLKREASNLAESVQVRPLNSRMLVVELPETVENSTVLIKYLQEGRIASIEPDQKTFRASDFQPATDDSSVELKLAEDATWVATLVDRELLVKSKAGKPLVVAVIDSGIDPQHKDLAPYLWKNEDEIPGNQKDDDGNGYVDDIYGWDFVNEDNQPIADDTRSYHGTHVSGIIKQAARLAEEGIHVQIMALKYLDDSAIGRTSNAIRAIEYAIQNGARVLNNSWGSHAYSQVLAATMDKVRQAKVLFVAAAGNGDSQGRGVNIDEMPFYPAAYAQDNIISVAATDERGALAPWSNFGAESVDLAAPGVTILSTRNGNTYGILSGTSMAAPFVSGVAAMIWSLRPDLSFFEVRKILAQSALATPSLSGKVATNSLIQREQALKIATSYVHDPTDQGGDLPLNEICQL